MGSDERQLKEYYVIDLAHIFNYLFKKLWVIILAGVIFAASAFVYSSYIIDPQYSSTVMLYVNNSSFSLSNKTFSISSDSINAAQGLVKTYIVILENRTTLEQVIENTGVDYTYEELAKMIDASPVNDTEVFQITITSKDAEEAAKIANGIAKVLPKRVADIIEGASMRYVDMAVVDNDKVSPSVTKYTAVGFLIGILLSCGVLAIFSLLDDTIHDVDYIFNNYDFPLLATIPDLYDTNESKYSKYTYYSQN